MQCGHDAISLSDRHIFGKYLAQLCATIFTNGPHFTSQISPRAAMAKGVCRTEVLKLRSSPRPGVRPPENAKIVYLCLCGLERCRIKFLRPLEELEEHIE